MGIFYITLGQVVAADAQNHSAEVDGYTSVLSPPKNMLSSITSDAKVDPVSEVFLEERGKPRTRKALKMRIT